jgi:CRP-like cAMP-binding protein
MRIKSDKRVIELRPMPLFSHCTSNQLAVVANIGAELSLGPGRVLAREGRAGREWLLIAAGLARVTIDGWTTAFVGPGDSVGDFALLRRCPHPATVMAETSLRAYVFNPREFWSVIDLCPTVGAALQARIVDHLPGSRVDSRLLSSA